MSGRKSRNKGRRVEQEAVRRFKKWGLHAERKLSQTRDGGHDVDLYLPKRQCEPGIKGLDYGFIGVSDGRGAPIIGEVKARENMSLKRVRDWLGENDWLLLQEDRKERLYVLPERIFKELVS